MCITWLLVFACILLYIFNIFSEEGSILVYRKETIENINKTLGFLAKTLEIFNNNYLILLFDN